MAAGTMRQIDLQEYKPGAYMLSDAQRDVLLGEQKTLGLTVQPVMGVENTYTLTPGSTVGALEIGDLSVLIEPKIGIPQLLSLACYAMGVFTSQEERSFKFEEEQALPDVLALVLATAARRAFSRGLLHGYRTEEEALYTVRGRIRFADQIRRRFEIPLPIEVRYDEFTDDITENRLVKAAVMRLGGMRLRSQQARKDLGRVAATLENVSLAEFSPKDVPEVRFDRLNEHYRGVVGLSRLILRHSAFESNRGEATATGFLMDMNVVFQEFVTTALREALRNSPYVLRSDKQLTGSHRTFFAKSNRVRLEPDLTLWDGTKCIFVGDTKYKTIETRGVDVSDLYQMLAYVTALDLPEGLLIYADGQPESMPYEVRNSGKRLEVTTLQLKSSLEDVLVQVDLLAEKILTLNSKTSTSNLDLIEQLRR